jgi:acyl-CoA dehydrogenase
MVDFGFTEEQDLFRRSVREWCEKNLPLEKVREIDEKHEVQKKIIKGLADLGLLLMTVPEGHGVVGADWTMACIAVEELGYADISIAIPVFFLVENALGGCCRQILQRTCERTICKKGD